MVVADKWVDYQIIATGDGYKLERWKDVTLLRPDPQVIWQTPVDMNNYKNLNYKLKNVKNASAEGKIYFTSQEIKKVMIDNILPYL